MQNNPEIEHIINTACVLAKDYKHEYVTLEHLLIALIESKNFQKLLTVHPHNLQKLYTGLSP